MHVLLIEAPYDYGAASTAVGHYFPLGLGYIAAVLRDAGEQVCLLVNFSNAGLSTEIPRQLAEFKPGLVGISCMTSSFPAAIAIARLVKAHSDARVVVGGHHVTALGDEVMADYPEVDFIVSGEGEETMLELCRKLDGNRGEVAGLMWRENGSIRRNPPRPLIQDIDRLPFPARDLVDMSAFGVHGYIRVGQRPATMITSRGCPYACNFCSSRLTMGRGYRMHSPEYVVEEMTSLALDYNIDSIVFEDDTFTVNPDRAARICDLLVERKLGMQWYCLSRVDRVTKPLLKHMQRAGCRMITFGIESGVQENLDRIGKKFTLEDARKAVQICDEVGLRTLGTFVIGFPFDTPETIQRTTDFARELPLTVAIFFPLVAYPGTACFEYLSPEQRPRTLDEWSRYVMGIAEPPFSFVANLSPRDLQLMVNQGHLRFYLRPGQVWRMVKTVRSMSELAGYADNALALGGRLLHGSRIIDARAASPVLPRGGASRRNVPARGGQGEGRQ